ncbi:MAG: glycosyltransferase family 4 protein, partial [Pseudomonadales bacterium]
MTGLIANVAGSEVHGGHDAQSLRLAFVLLRYFPFGGLQRDFLRIAKACQARGHRVEVHTLRWEGARPEGFVITEYPLIGVTNHARVWSFADRVAAVLATSPVDCVIGFNRIPGLDIYYAADPCFALRLRRPSAVWLRWLPRFRAYLGLEAAVFGPEGASRILTLTPAQERDYRDCYGTPASRFRRIPPPLSSDRVRPLDADSQRAEFRREFALDNETCVLLALGSGFATKGLDRSLRALAAIRDL